ncbi:MAG: ATP-dependent helicase [Candidatus Eremiobacteraeota bacterium]|nr:ATP-dependent helicase [Candidatus Eremiobacteraeota bacterium]
MHTLDEQQSAAAAATVPGLLTVTGPAGSGKTTALFARAQSLYAAQNIFVGAPRIASCQRLRQEFAASPGVEIMTVEHLGFLVLETALQLAGLPSIDLIDDVDASIVFARAADPLFLMKWAEFIEAQIDPEVPGLRSPQRFLEAAFRLISKLRDAQMAPATFLETALKGASQFYARPPNFAHPDLLYYTKDSYRNSLNVDAAELQRQYRREVDLAKVLEKLYRTYLELLVAKGHYTGADAVADAIKRLSSDAQLRSHFESRYSALLIDDAQELSSGELLLLQALRGEELSGVTFFADPASALGTFSGARPDKVFALQATRVELEGSYRCAPLVECAARHIAGADAVAAIPQGGHITLFRAATKRAEAAFVAEHIVDLLNSGVAPGEIAVLFRSVENVAPYEAALLERNVEVQVSGDVNIFRNGDALDALALLWNIHNPFAHEWLLRTLSGRAWTLSDASVVTLCSEPENGQPLLFEELQADDAAPSRWDRKRDIRLGWNVVRGDQDRALSSMALERLLEFRALREQWTQDVKRYDLPELAAKVFAEGLAGAGPPGSALARCQIQNINRLLARIEHYYERSEGGTLADFLNYAQLRITSDLEACEEDVNTSVVRFMSISAAMGNEFDHVVIPNSRAGSFPRYYAPDAFLFSPSLGMIAKENVGEALASRTAKFTYYMFRAKTRESYNRQERRAFVYAMRRARKSLIVTASERATRGMTSPEFLSELQAARLPGALDLSDRWRPAHSMFGVATG